MKNSELTQSWKTISSEVVHENKWFKVRKDYVIRPGGVEGEYFVVEKKPVVFIVALTEKKEIYLINLFRYTTKQQSWEIPAGATDEGETGLEAAKRELQEETGLRAKKWIEVGQTQYANGISNGICQIYLAQDLEETNDNSQKQEGIGNMQKVSFDQVLDMIKNNEITNGQSISAIMLAGLKLRLLGTPTTLSKEKSTAIT